MGHTTRHPAIRNEPKHLTRVSASSWDFARGSIHVLASEDETTVTLVAQRACRSEDLGTGYFCGKAESTSLISWHWSNWSLLKVQPRRTTTAFLEGTMATSWPQCPSMAMVSAGTPG